MGLGDPGVTLTGVCSEQRDEGSMGRRRVSDM